MSDSLVIAKPTQQDIALGRKTQKRLLEGVYFAGSKAERDRKKAQEQGLVRRLLNRGPVLPRLEALLAKTKALNPDPTNGAVAAMQAYVDGVKETLDTEEKLNDFRKLVTDAHEGDSQSRIALGMSIAESVGHLVRSTSNWLSWYDVRTLAEDEIPFLHNYVPQTINVRIGNSDGTLRQHHGSPNDSADERVSLYFILSDVFTGIIFDVYKGDIKQMQLGTVDIAMDIAESIDGVAQTAITVGSANSIYTDTFVTDGSPAAHYHASNRIQTGNFPTGNIIAAAGNGASTLPRLAVLTAIHEYYSRFGSGVFDGQDAVPVAIHVAAIHAAAFSAEFTPTSHMNRYTDQVFQNPFSLEAHGRNFLIVPDNTIDPADKHVYVRPNLPIGLHFQKPAGDKVGYEEDDRNNEFKTWERKCIGWAFPVTWQPRSVAIKFKS